MSNNARYRLFTSLKLKKTHKQMVKNFDVRQVSTSKLKDHTELIYFSVNSEPEQKRIEEFFNGIGLKYEQTRK